MLECPDAALAVVLMEQTLSNKVRQARASHVMVCYCVNVCRALLQCIVGDGVHALPCVHQMLEVSAKRLNTYAAGSESFFMQGSHRCWLLPRPTVL